VAWFRLRNHAPWCTGHAFATARKHGTHRIKCDGPLAAPPIPGLHGARVALRGPILSTGLFNDDQPEVVASDRKARKALAIQRQRLVGFGVAGSRCRLSEADVGLHGRLAGVYHHQDQPPGLGVPVGTDEEALLPGGRDGPRRPLEKRGINGGDGAPAGHPEPGARASRVQASR